MSAAHDAPAAVAKRASGYWFEDIPHQGIAAFNANPGPGAYKVFRNVKDYGARGE
jgi:glucan 1,3-beta-glucosidase